MHGLTLICNERDVIMTLNKIQILQLVKVVMTGEEEET